MDVTCSFQVSVTVVANEFIDRYMAAANGEYVKVYLYILRHQQEKLDVSMIADALNHTESDVKRALAYWEKLGALKSRDSGVQDAGQPAYAGAAQSAPEADDIYTGALRTAGGGGLACADGTPVKRGKERPVYSQEQVNSLAGDEDFTQLLYIAQKYMNKVFTPRECEVFAYLYDGLHMTAELLEYLVEYCVQGGHTSIRYIEAVALNWHEKGLRTVDEAKSYSSCFTKDSFAVMRAFGLADRRPAEPERELIERWFGTYGFTKELVLEACSRTIQATHSPSFRYADKILTEWKKAGVKNLSDVAVLDQNRQKKQAAKNGDRKNGQKPNQFHNFEQRNTDYESIMLDQVKSWISEA